MKAAKIHIGKLFLANSLVLLLWGLLMGLLASLSYVLPASFLTIISFESIRPMHVSSVMFWIILGASGCVYSCMEILSPHSFSKTLAMVQWLLWLVAISGVFYSYSQKKFGGREYWEFDPVWALPIAGAWIIFLVNFFKSSTAIKKWPVYVWMWMTGIIFFLFTFIENYLWLIPYFREHFVTDTTIQWKVNGSLVGAWNQIIYGTAFFLMEKISGNHKTGNNKLAFAMYFLGLFNLMFNWGHHVYALPVENYVRNLGYAVSMTEWIIFARIVYAWRGTVSEIQKHYHYFPYRFLMAADIWVLINLAQALLMSVPALNLYTHGTHVTVAHAMGTTIGINTMILFAAGFEFFGSSCAPFSNQEKNLTRTFWIAQTSLLVFWIALNGAGIQKGIWQMNTVRGTHAQMMSHLQGWFILFATSGVFIMLSLSALSWALLHAYIRCDLGIKKKKKVFTSPAPLINKYYGKFDQLQ